MINAVYKPFLSWVSFYSKNIFYSKNQEFRFFHKYFVFIVFTINGYNRVGKTIEIRT